MLQRINCRILSIDVLFFSDGSRAENAMTNMEDGTFALHKSLLNRTAEHTFNENNVSVDGQMNPPQSPSLWKKSPGTSSEHNSLSARLLGHTPYERTLY